jgi:hypothetical protein
VDTPTPRYLVAFVRSVAVLALPAQAQQRWASRLADDDVAFVDEVALEFDDGLHLVPTFIELGWINASALPVLTQLDGRLAAMSGVKHAVLWQTAALSSEPDWDTVRTLATDALILMG